MSAWRSGDLAPARVVISIVLAAMVLLPLAGVRPASADPDAASSRGGPLDERAAMVRAQAEGRPVEVTAKTDERTRIVADPATGSFRGEFTAGVARVTDGKGGWRDADTTLQVGSDGLLHPVAARLPIAISNGGSTDVIRLGVGGQSVGLAWDGHLPAPVVTGDTAVYLEVLPGVDLVARAFPETVSTYLVVKDRAAAANPRVRAVTFRVNGSGVSAVHSDETGGAAFLDADGAERVAVSALSMWDSSGKEVGAASADRVVPSDTARGAEMSASVSTNELVVTPDASLLDDPDAVYPIVIDPTLSDRGATFYQRVTYSWTHTNTAGDDARVGYNGWTSPFYESELYYRFDLGGMAASNIRSATFSHDNVHSVQHAPCYKVDYGAPILVGVTGAFDANTKWNSRPGWHANPASNSNAVGNSSNCPGARWTLNWDLTSQMQEIGVTYWQTSIGMKGGTWNDRNNWRHFYNVFGAGSSSRPLLAIEYVPLPDPVQYVRVASSSVLSQSTSYVYPKTLRPTFEAALPATTHCRSNDPCYRVRFDYMRIGQPLTRQEIYSPVAGAGSVVSAQPPVDLSSNAIYLVQAFVENTDYELYSSHQNMSPRLRTVTSAPVAPTATPTSGTITSGSTWSTVATTTVEGVLVSKWCLEDVSVTDQGQFSHCSVVSASSRTLTTPTLTVTSGRQLIKQYYAWACYVTGSCARTDVLTVTVNQ